MHSQLFHLNLSDFQKGLVMAALGGLLLPIAKMIQTPGFDIFRADWHGILVLAINGAITAFVGYIAQSFVSDEQGKVFGRIG